MIATRKVYLINFYSQTIYQIIGLAMARLFYSSKEENLALDEFEFCYKVEPIIKHLDNKIEYVRLHDVFRGDYVFFKEWETGTLIQIDISKEVGVNDSILSKKDWDKKRISDLLEVEKKFKVVGMPFPIELNNELIELVNINIDK